MKYEENEHRWFVDYKNHTYVCFVNDVVNVVGILGQPWYTSYPKDERLPIASIDKMNLSEKDKQKIEEKIRKKKGYLGRIEFKFV